MTYTPEPPIPNTILPCPFCGDDDILPIYEDAYHLWAVCCEDCDVRMEAGTELEAIKRWNTRAHPTPDPGGLRTSMEAELSHLLQSNAIDCISINVEQIVNRLMTHIDTPHVRTPDASSIRDSNEAFERWSLEQGWDISGPEARMRRATWQAAWSRAHPTPDSIHSYADHCAYETFEWLWSKGRGWEACFFAALASYRQELAPSVNIIRLRGDLYNFIQETCRVAIKDGTPSIECAYTAEQAEQFIAPYLATREPVMVSLGTCASAAEPELPGAYFTTCEKVAKAVLDEAIKQGARFDYAD